MNSIAITATATITSSREFKAVFNGTLYDILTNVGQMVGGFKTEDNRRLSTVGELEAWFDGQKGRWMTLYSLDRRDTRIEFALDM